MRVLMLNNEFPPLGGGTGTVTSALLARFARIPGLEIDLITSAQDGRRGQTQLSQTIRILKVPTVVRSVHHATNRELTAYAHHALWAALRLHRGAPYDLCMAWSAVPAGGVALALRRLTGLRYIVRVSGPDIPGFEVRYRRIYPLLTPLIRAIWRGADKVVAKCAGEAQMIRAVDGHISVAIISNGVDADVFLPGV
ncbi:MAG: glycosyltransferase, partial [Anaerolineae bacterium]